MRSIGHVFAAHTVYRNAVKRVTKKALAHYLSSVIPENMCLEWEQDKHEVLTPVIFCNLVQIVTKTGEPVKPKTDPDNPHTEWVKGEHWDGYFLSEGVKKYRNTIPGLSRKALAKVIGAWNALPKDMLLEVFGIGSVRVTGGKITFTPWAT